MADTSAAATAATPSLRRTPLHGAAQAAGGRLVPFAGWEMAVQFAGLVAEHTAVRERCGVFDISHMGVLTLRGEGVKERMQALVPSDLFRIGPGEACYTVLLNEAGGIRDDLIIYDRGRRPAGAHSAAEIAAAAADSGASPDPTETDELVLVINAACAEAD
ncbi:MAG: hypothetical protein ACKOPS_25070, partial [Cyanobium sp.]